MTDFMDPMTEQRVNFGTRDDDTMPLAWASKALTWLKVNRPQVFADMMTEGVFGIEKTRRGGK
jgi:hypothetical protein